MKRKSVKIGILFMILIVSLSAIGVGYGLWSKYLHVDGTVHTGYIDFEYGWTGLVWENDWGKNVAECGAFVNDEGVLNV